jgi:hypothetical protein
LEEFFLTEVFDKPAVEVDQVETAAGLITIPTRSATREDGNRRPIDAGYVLGWTEWPVDDPQQRERRRGMVMSWAPNAKSVWVIPDERRDGEGMHVVVREVTAESTSGAYRIVGGPGDYRSTTEWQSPRSLPRPYRRTFVRSDTFGVVEGEWLHADPQCRQPRPCGGKVEHGEAVPVDTCYVFRGALHTMSIRPALSDGRPVPLCVCLNGRLPD